MKLCNVCMTCACVRKQCESGSAKNVSKMKDDGQRRVGTEACKW